MVKNYTPAQVDAIIRMKFGRPVTSQFNLSYVSNAMLGRLFKCSATTIRELYMRRFAELKGVPTVDQVKKRYGIRYVSAEAQRYIVDRDTLKSQTGLSLADRCK